MSGTEILVSGATGRTGGAAIAELLKMGRSVRAYVRSDGERASALGKQGIEIAVGDFTDIDAIRAAMGGIRSAYFLYPIAPGILGAAAYFAQAAKEAGVTAIVNMSQISARRESASPELPAARERLPWLMDCGAGPPLAVAPRQFE